ncbi:Asp23/Gls24 family envelope stress response protein [Leuconostocaceae bacterium ESL0723]|nr:Asp23/Gls24 family envelope stress response protein [Leuconostocaceae bacterium ESL0723]
MVGSIKNRAVGSHNFTLPTHNDIAGVTQVTPGALQTIAQGAIEEVPGVYAMRGSLTDSFSKVFGAKMFGSGVELSQDEEGLVIDAFVFLDYGVTVPRVALAVQQAVIGRLKNQTGLTVSQVNVEVSGIVPVKDSHQVDPNHLFDETEVSE